MPVENFLQPSENVVYQSPERVSIGDDKYELYVTDQRLLLYRRSGLILKRDTFIAERLSDIRGIGFKEKGTFTKKGFIAVETMNKTTTFAGNAARMRQLYQELQPYTSAWPALGETPDHSGLRLITAAYIVSRGGAVAARRAHNPKVAGSSPAPATRHRRSAP